MENSISLETAKKLMKCFPGSYINQHGEFIAVPSEWKSGDAWFNVSRCENEMDLRCKVLEQLSRPAYKSEPYETARLNKRFHEHISQGVNHYLGTSFTEDDFRLIYNALGNGIERGLTRQFIESGYDMALLMERKDG